MKFLTFFLLLTVIIACNYTEPKTSEQSTLPIASGDAQAINLAKKVIEASGGMDNWNKINTITWNFFNRRVLTWNKHENVVRIDFTKQPLRMWVDLNQDSLGEVNYQGKFLKSDSLQLFLDKAKSIWINDSYWLCFPFKLLDPGVRLQIGKSDTTMLGEKAITLWLSFENVGDTPENRYKVYIDPNTHLISQWDYFKDSLSTVPDLSTTFEDYQTFEGVLISQKRSGFTLSDIKTFQSNDVNMLKDLEKNIRE